MLIDNYKGLIFGSVESSYWDTETSGQSESYGGEGKITAQMKQRATFDGWNFNNIWGIEGGISYPYLLNNEQVPHPQ